MGQLCTFMLETVLFLHIGNLTRKSNAHIIKAAKFLGLIYCIGEISKVTAENVSLEISASFLNLRTKVGKQFTYIDCFGKN